VEFSLTLEIASFKRLDRLFVILIG